MSGIDAYVRLDSMLSTMTGSSANEIAEALQVTPRHARRMVDKIRDAFGAVWDLQVLTLRPCGMETRYRYRTYGARAFTGEARRIAS
jgi:predicted DNA-binding transcriptional regulator YafY